jgi:RHS repeat-associated protein
MLRDLNKGMAADIVYNRFNFPETVNFGGGKTISYKYNGAGAKLQKIINDNGDNRTFDYIGGFVYESNILQHFPHPEGRVRNSDGTLVYDYVLTDHLGNSRITFTTQASPTLVYKATMETEISGSGYNIEAVEEQLFYNLDASRIASSTANYSTAFDDDCTSCNEGAQTNSTQRTGPAIILDVMPGDVLDLEVYAKSAGGSGTNSIAKSVLVNALVNAFVPSGLGSELGTQTQSVFNGTSVYNAMQGGSPSGSNPRAFLNYIVFDQHFTVVSQGHDPVKSTAFHKLSFSSLSIAQKGYVYVWVSNENCENRTVYFDVLKISHTKSNILQEDHYYPFGMNMHGLSSSASLSKPNNYKFNGGTELTADFGWQMYDTPFRSYDAQLGRFHQIDPLADSYASQTPYNFANNDPVYWNDPTGLAPNMHDFINTVLNDPNATGGYWNGITGEAEIYRSDEEAFWRGFVYFEENNLWSTGSDYLKDGGGGGAINRFYESLSVPKSAMGATLFRVFTKSGIDPWSNYKLSTAHGIFTLTASLRTFSSLIVGIFRFSKSGELVGSDGKVTGLVEYNFTESIDGTALSDANSFSYSIWTQSVASPLARVLQHDLSNGQFPFPTRLGYIRNLESGASMSNQDGDAYFQVGRAIAFGGPDYSHLSKPFIPSSFNMWRPSWNRYLKYLKN